ncbi:MAG: diguanylate cyclase, partial [Dokdonella sp.]|uniref:ligand-binding sensor domain-containing diguanylate cyclase n=1 Tax=Dokdonella sp. TaxID=2291710 RepID=UPI00326732E9
GIDLPTGERSFAVGALAQARDGAVWIGTDSVGAWRITGNGKQALDLPGASGPVGAFFEAPDGRMWIAASEGLFRCAVTRCERIEALGAAGARSLFGETIDGQWRLWVGTNFEGVIQLADIDGATPTRTDVAITKAQGLPNNVGLSMARYAGDLWIGSGRGVARYDGKRLQVFGEGNQFPTAMVFALLPDVDPAGEQVLLAALRPGGLAEIHADGRWRLIDTRHGLPSNAVHSLLRERYRNVLWIGTMTAGIARVENDRFALFDERMGLPDRIVLSVGWSAPTGTLWVGTAGGAARWGAGRFVPLLPPGQNAELVHDLIDTSDGRRWIAHSRGLQRWKGDTLELDFTADNSALPGVSVEQVVQRHIDGGDEIYAATAHGLARWTSAEGVKKIDGVAGLDVETAVHGLAVLADPANPGDDILWVATESGLSRLDRRGWRVVNAPCLADLAPFRIEPDQRAGAPTLWLASRSGLRRLDADGTCVTYPATHALGALTHVRLDGAAVYVFGARGAMRLAREGAADQQGETYGAQAGLVSPEVTASAVDNRGRVFGATAAGLAAFQPALSTQAAASSPLHLTAAHWGAQSTPLTAGLVLPPDDNGVRFEYSLLAFDREYAVRYRTRLAGLEEDFSPWSADAFAAYPRLPPGHYQLQVQARDADGVAAQPLSFDFAVDAHWWQRGWTLAAGALLTLALGLGIGRWRSRRTSRRAAALEVEVAMRTRELASANAQLEQAAVTDPLTGLKNRRYFTLAVAAETERARRARGGQMLLVALLDIDHFKRINDGHGHDAGDAVLLEIARRLQRAARAGDIVLRWGGEEFLLLLRDIDRAAADVPLRRLLAGIAAKPVQVGALAIDVTASIGAIGYPADASGDADLNLEHAIALADAALYRAKREGRDRAMLVECNASDGELCCAVVMREEVSLSGRSKEL